MWISVAAQARCGDHIRFRGEQVMFLCKGCKQAARGFRFDFAAKCCAAGLECNLMCRVSH
jgi:hypothetical protein